ncbi:MAG: hypothetical protein K8R21_07055, partial [Leptospira sp.]|nr:hypothetical protein [Leptospira sp.]
KRKKLVNQKMTVKVLEKELLDTFQGKFVWDWNVSPMMKNNFENLYKIWRNEEKKPEGKKLSTLSGMVESRKSLAGRQEETNQNQGDFMNVGFLETKKRKDDSGKESEFFNLKINLPLFPPSEFFCVENKEKKNQNSPDLLVFYQKNLVGSIWNNTYTDKKTNAEKKFRSGSIFFLGGKDNKLNFACFTNEKTGMEVVSIREKDETEPEAASAEDNLPDGKRTMNRETIFKGNSKPG